MKDQCMRDGWRSLGRKDGTHFLNQGECVQYVNNNKVIGSGVLWKGDLLPCSLNLCGGSNQNIATLGVEKGEVSVMRDGLVRVRLYRLKMKATGEIAANRTLDVNIGNFTKGVFEVASGLPQLPIGTITTDKDGNFNGTVDTGGGVAFRLTSSISISAQFAFNEPGVRTEFVTGFIVP
jgi:hypothetical protein